MTTTWTSKACWRVLVLTTTLAGCHASVPHPPRSAQSARPVDWEALQPQVSKDLETLMQGPISNLMVDLLAWKESRVPGTGCRPMTDALALAGGSRSDGSKIVCMIRYQRLEGSDWSKPVESGAVPSIWMVDCADGAFPIEQARAFLQRGVMPKSPDPDPECWKGPFGRIAQYIDTAAWRSGVGEVPDSDAVFTRLFPVEDPPTGW